MKRYLRLLLIFIAIFIGFQFSNIPIKAATAPVVNYSVTPELNSDQFDKKIGYYDLKLKPNQKGSIKFKINNNSQSTQSYDIQINRATTDTNGVIVYNKHNVKPEENLKYNIEKLVTYPKLVSVGAKSSKEVTVGITMPNGNFNGELLGGILVEENNQINNKIRKGVSLKNKYDYVLGLQLQENTESVKPDLKLNRVYETTTNTEQISVDGQIDNDVPRLEKKVSVNAKITPIDNKKVILKSEKKNMSIAPDSDFDYPVDVNSLTGTNKNRRLKSGTYTMYLNVSANGNNNWHMQRNFTITKKQVAKVNKKTPNYSKGVWIIVGLISALVIIAGSVVWKYRKGNH